MGFGHGGEGFGVSGWSVLEEVFDEEGGQAQAAVGGVDDDARDGADVLVDETEALGGGEAVEIEGAAAGAGVDGGVGEDGDGDGDGAREGGELVGELVADGPDPGEGCGAATAVVETLKCFVICAGAGRENKTTRDEREVAKMDWRDKRGPAGQRGNIRPGHTFLPFV